MLTTDNAPDWSRETPRAFWSPGPKLVRSIRDYQRWAGRKDPMSVIRRKIATLRHRFWSIVAGADIPLNCKIGGGLMIPHPVGIVIHPDTKVGNNVFICQCVTIGVRMGAGVPEVSHNAYIGAGAKVLGNVKIGQHARIGANAVVLTDVPAYATATGIPATIRNIAP